MFCFWLHFFPVDAPLAGYIGIKNVREIYANGSKLSLVVSYAVFLRSLLPDRQFLILVRSSQSSRRAPEFNCI